MYKFIELFRVGYADERLVTHPQDGKVFFSLSDADNEYVVSKMRITDMGKRIKYSILIPVECVGTTVRFEKSHPYITTHADCTVERKVFAEATMQVKWAQAFRQHTPQRRAMVENGEAEILPPEAFTS